MEITGAERQIDVGSVYCGENELSKTARFMCATQGNFLVYVTLLKQQQVKNATLYNYIR